MRCSCDSFQGPVYRFIQPVAIEAGRPLVGGPVVQVHEHVIFGFGVDPQCSHGLEVTLGVVVELLDGPKAKETPVLPDELQKPEQVTACGPYEVRPLP
eukprot:10146388-Lingulodinium_polyedra.AAC.1